MADKRAPHSDENLRTIINTAITTTDPALSGFEWEMAVRERAASIITLEDEFLAHLRQLDVCYSDPTGSRGKAYKGVLVAAYIDPKMAWRGFIRFLSPDMSQGVNGPWVEEEYRTVPLRGNPAAQAFYAKAVSLIGHRVLIALNKDESAPAKTRPWVLTHLQDYGLETSRPDLVAEWARATPVERNNRPVPLPRNAHMLPSGAPPAGFTQDITDPQALEIHALGGAVATSAPVATPVPAAAPVPEPAPATQPVSSPVASDVVSEPEPAVQPLPVAVPEQNAPGLPPQQAYLHQEPPAPAPAQHNPSSAQTALIEGAKTLGVPEKEALDAARGAWKAANLGSYGEVIPQQAVDEGLAWIRSCMKSRAQQQPAPA